MAQGFNTLRGHGRGGGGDHIRSFPGRSSLAANSRHRAVPPLSGAGCSWFFGLATDGEFRLERERVEAKCLVSPSSPPPEQGLESSFAGSLIAAGSTRELNYIARVMIFTLLVVASTIALGDGRMMSAWVALAAFFISRTALNGLRTRFV